MQTCEMLHHSSTCTSKRHYLSNLYNLELFSHAASRTVPEFVTEQPQIVLDS